MITFPIWFKCFLGLFGFVIITGTIRLVAKGKIIDSMKILSDEKRNKLLKSSSQLVKIYKYFIWAIPLNLIIIPYIFYRNIPKEFFHITVMMSIVYVVTIEDYFYRKSIVNSLIINNSIPPSLRFTPSVVPRSLR